ncbi:hypothetical protein PMAYCL1PPCAC_01569, partial [Pristionchus mayeri]
TISLLCQLGCHISDSERQFFDFRRQFFCILAEFGEFPRQILDCHFILLLLFKSFYSLVRQENQPFFQFFDLFLTENIGLLINNSLQVFDARLLLTSNFDQ